MGQTFSLRAGARRLDISTNPREAVKVSTFDMGDPQQESTIAKGRDGGLRLGANDLEESTVRTIEVDCAQGNCPGDKDGRAVNRVSGRDWVSDPAQITWTPDVSELSTLPSVFDFAAEVRSNVAGTVILEVLRGATVVASTQRAVTADCVGRQLLPNGRFASGLDGYFQDSVGAPTSPTFTPGDMPDGGGPGVRVQGTSPNAGTRSMTVSSGFTTASRAPVVPGQVVWFGARGLATANTTQGWSVKLLWFAADGTQLGTTQTTAQVTGNVSRRATAQATAPAGAAYATLQVVVSSTAAESWDVWFTKLSIGDLDYYRDGDARSFGWAWEDLSKPHASRSRKVTGPATPIELPAASIAGTGTLTFRVRYASPQPGARLEARLPVCGEGLGCKYHDSFTPGASIQQPQGRCERMARGEAWANAVANMLSEAAGACASDEAAYLVRTGDDLTEPAFLDVQRAAAPAPQDAPHAIGYGTAKLTLTCVPGWRLTARTLPGRIDYTTVDGGLTQVYPVFQPSLAAIGDYEAPARITAGWNTGGLTAPRATRWAMSSALPRTYVGAPGNALWSSGTTETGEPTSYASGPLRGQASPVVSWTLDAGTATGRYGVDVRCGLNLGNANGIAPSATLTLLVNGRVVATRTLDGTTYGGTTDVNRRMRTVSFGVTSLAPSARVQLVASTNGAEQATTVYLSVGVLTVTGPQIAGAVVELPDDVARGGVAPMLAYAGDEISAVNDSTSNTSLNGRTGRYGGTWTAGPSFGYNAAYGGTSGLPGIYASSSGAGQAKIGAATAVNAGTMVVRALMYFVGRTGSAANGVGLFATTGSGKVVVREAAGRGLEVLISNADGSSAPVYTITRPARSTPANPLTDVSIQVDAAGGVLIRAGDTDERIVTIFAGFVPTLATQTLQPAIQSGSAGLVARSMTFQTTTAAGARQAWTWGAGLSDQTVSGATPRLIPGTRPRIIVRAECVPTSSPAYPAAHPVSYSLTYAPRVFQVQR